MKYRVKLFVFFFPPLIAALFIGGDHVQADPAKYPQYAQQTLPPGVKPEFIKLDALVNEIINRRTPVMIDVRSAEEYQEAHIKGAISIPLDEFERRIGEIPRDRPLVLYWACPHHLASLAYGILHTKGYRDMKVLDEGLPGWIEKRYPVEGTKVAP